MSPTPTVAVCLGTRPELIKLAPVIGALRRSGRVAVRVLFTGQHRELLDQMADDFQLAPDVDLAVMEPGQTLAGVTGRILHGIDELLVREAPELVLVQGDTTTVFTAALACFYRKIAVGHVEAGLRTGDRFQPFPEEINRRLVTPLADLHFAPTEGARDNLLREGVSSDSVFVTGNTSIDAVLMMAERDAPLPIELQAGKPLITVTIHRREAFGEPIRHIFRALLRIAQQRDVQVVYPVHPNPLVQQAAQEVLGDSPSVRLVPPLSYGPFVSLLKRSTLIITDSGGIQEEAPALGVPVLVAREVTERPEGVAAGVARLVGTTTEGIVTNALALLSDEEARATMARAKNPYGDGKASERIAARCIELLDTRRSTRP